MYARRRLSMELPRSFCAPVSALRRRPTECDSGEPRDALVMVLGSDDDTSARVTQQMEDALVGK